MKYNHISKKINGSSVLLEVWQLYVGVNPRFTLDIDLTIFSGIGKEEKYIDNLIQIYKTRRKNMKKFALKYRVILLETPEGYVAIAFEEKMIRRSTYFTFKSDIRLKTCSAEDLIILKAFAEREQDWGDIKGIIIRKKNKLNWGYIFRHLRPLCDLKESPHILVHLKDLKRKLT